ncbi:MAG: response regulator [Sphingobacteriales bacterium]|nr:MAG: response regulator [Sphingobacteriales bacterium]
MEKLKNILLVDDDEITNYINCDLIKELNITENISVANNGKEALDYLIKAHQSPAPEGFYVPDLIFLDINMPVMNGFQFLEDYYYLLGDKKLSTIVTMLTTSLIKEEVSRALEMVHVVKGYIEKPLTKEIIMEIYNTHLELQDQKPARVRRKG